jgi:hypothetical protein
MFFLLGRKRIFAFTDANLTDLSREIGTQVLVEAI